jgi:GTP1/Obg family GTP-binding protein
MASFIINCPNCQHQFEPGDSMRDEIQKELRNQMLDWQNKKDQEFKSKELAFQQLLSEKDKESATKLEQEKQRLQTELQESIKKSMSSDYENKLKLLEDAAAESAEKLKE